MAVRETYVLRDGKLVPKRLAPPTPVARSALPRPFVIGDGCEFRSMADGRVYTSKAAYRADLRARGLVEVGNETSYVTTPPAEYEPEGVEQSISDAWDQLEAA